MDQVGPDDAATYTNAHFGCIYFRKNDLSVTKIDLDIDDGEE